jgi:hypothetical protein
MNYIWLSLLFCITYISGISAQDQVIINGGDPRRDAGSIIAAIILYIVGLTFVFAGKRVIKILLFIVGFIFFGALSLVIAARIVDVESVTSGQRIGIIVGSVIVGILGGMLSWCLYKLGIAILGFLMGFSIGGLIVNGISSLQDSFWTRLGIMIGCGLAVSILMIFLMSIMIVVATSFVGSQLFMIGVDVLANKGYLMFVEVYSKFKSVQMTPVLWAMLGSSLVLTLIGILVQWKAFSKKEYYDNKGNRN